MPDKISIADLVPMDVFIPSEPIEIDVVYTKASHPENIFKTALYHPDTRLCLHKDLAKIVIAAARSLHDQHDTILILKDGLRPYESQVAMSKTQIVKDNPHWLEEPTRLISSPGAGGHPRGMAIDVSLRTTKGTAVDMGTIFDEMTDQSARAYTDFNMPILENRRILEQAFVLQAQLLSLPMLPLPSEWWDFRFPRSYSEQWSALHENDLPLPLRTINPAHDDTGIWDQRFDICRKEVLNSL